MTGELCDCFRNKRAGVNAILDAVQTVAHDRPVQIWSLDGFVDVPAARQRYLRVASANWHALATQVAREFCPEQSGLLLDVGSTTTDIIPLSAGLPIARGTTDPERLLHGELVYTGVRRTPLCALLGAEVAAELFATTLDVYLVLGHLSEDANDLNTADGRAATLTAAHARLARMLCADDELFTFAEARQFARRAVVRQVEWLTAALARVTAAMPEAPRSVVLAGSGEFLAQLVTRDARTVSLRDAWGADQSAAACARAVAKLSLVTGH